MTARLVNAAELDVRELVARQQKVMYVALCRVHLKVLLRTNNWSNHSENCIKIDNVSYKSIKVCGNLPASRMEQNCNENFSLG